MEGKNIDKIKPNQLVIRVEPTVYGTRRNLKENSAYMDKPLFYTGQTINYICFKVPSSIKDFSFEGDFKNLTHHEWQDGWLEYSEYLENKKISSELLKKGISELEDKTARN